MTWPMFVPALTLTLLSVIAARRPLPLHPAWSARLLLTLTATTALTVLSTLTMVAAVFVAGFLPADMVAATAKGRLLLGHGPVSPLLGVPALLLLGSGAVGIVLLVARRRRERRELQGVGVAPDDRPFAVAVPGARGGVVVSRGLLRLLTREQMSVVFRHEHAHLRHRHHLYTAAGAVAARLFPPLAPLEAELRLAVERWADEAAAEAVGDRALVAHTIAAVALANPVPRPTWHPALAHFHVVQRVRALLGDAPSTNPIAGPALLSGTGVATSGVASSALQLHHAAALLLL
ncbi:M48 family metalloprotease [Nocardiopsis sediminis]|uniref:M48 family metalloprotease n=1 Tax=Nocardiopsis sediminis TaxID=1778267 RepID=A0ABV8FLM0_9ACTN